MKFAESDAGFGYDETFFSIDLFGENTKKGETGGYRRLAIVPGRDMECEAWVIIHHSVVMHDGHKRERGRRGGWGGLLKGLIGKQTHFEDLI